MKEEKKCSKCGEVKTLDEFYKDKRRLFGVRPECKSCRWEVLKEKYRQDEEYRQTILEKERITRKAKKAIGSWWDEERIRKGVNPLV